MENFFDIVLNVLKQDERFFAEDGTFLRNAVYEAAMQMDENLIRLLISNEDTKSRFFKEVDDILVFDKVGFAWVINNREFLPDSYTRFKNKIGLADEYGKMISTSGKVELVFPYKDCVLEGGQTKEEQKRSEIFYNETLAPDEVDRLLYPKVFCNARRYKFDGGKSDLNRGLNVICERVTDISDKDNLIIKGNNLLVISSLLERFEGKIKCIYIDPPYFFQTSKNEDTFAYNSNFKMSTWLTFMKNRLEIARKLLREDGAIFVQISDDGVAELHCLLKEIFNKDGENNFINKITVKTKSPSGFASVNPGVFETAEYILAFAKHKQKWTYNPQYTVSEYDKNYKWYVENIDDDPSVWKIVDIFKYIADKNDYSSPKEAEKELGESVFNDIVSKFTLDHSDSIFQSTAIGDNAGQDVVEKRNISKKNKGIVYTVVRDGHYTVHIYNGREMAFYSKKIRIIDGRKVPSMQLSNIWIDTPYEGIAKEGNVTLKGGKKPEKLLRRIIEMSTNKGDIVLDYHLGSGTTCAVAHKLDRQYIGIEQLDYGNNDSISRLKNVLEGDATGISKAVNWQGGGSFVYCELAKLNQNFADEIQVAADTDTLKDIYHRMVKSGFISCKVNPADIDAAASDFETLSLDDQKRFLMELLDKNLLYVNYCDMDDEDFKISEEDKAFTRSFYKED